MTWLTVGKVMAGLAFIAFLSGPRWARRLLIALGLLMFAMFLWIAAICVGDKGFGTVALRAMLETLVIVVPIGVLGAAGILIGWGLRRLLGISGNSSVWEAARRR